LELHSNEAFYHPVDFAQTVIVQSEPKESKKKFVEVKKLLKVGNGYIETI
jgi:hypothetical protein